MRFTLTYDAPVDSDDPGDGVFENFEKRLAETKGWLVMRTYTPAPHSYRAVYLGFSVYGSGDRREAEAAVKDAIAFANANAQIQYDRIRFFPYA